jgi:hypothetical protein
MTPSMPAAGEDFTMRSTSEVLLKPVRGSLPLRPSCCKTRRRARSNRTVDAIQVQSAAGVVNRPCMWTITHAHTVLDEFNLRCLCCFRCCHRWA